MFRKNGLSYQKKLPALIQALLEFKFLFNLEYDGVAIYNRFAFNKRYFLEWLDDDADKKEGSRMDTFSITLKELLQHYRTPNSKLLNIESTFAHMVLSSHPVVMSCFFSRYPRVFEFLYRYLCTDRGIQNTLRKFLTELPVLEYIDEINSNLKQETSKSFSVEEKSASPPKYHPPVVNNKGNKLFDARSKHPTKASSISAKIHPDGEQINSKKGNGCLGCTIL